MTEPTAEDSGGAPSALAVRAIRPDEWQRMRDFRIEALHDEAAPIAFLSTLAQTTELPDATWQHRARAGSEDAGDDARQRTLIALQGERWIGTVTILVTNAGDTDFLGESLTTRVADVVGAYVRASARGTGAIQDLLDDAMEWTVGRGLAQLRLFVHEQNTRAHRAYEKAGFRFTGAQLMIGDRRELEMVRPAEPQGAHDS